MKILKKILWFWKQSVNTGKQYAFFIIFLFITSISSSQIRSGYRFGINFSSVNFRTDRVCYNLKTPLGIHFGVFYDIPLKKHFSFNPGFVFSSKGTEYKDDTVKYSLTPTYIEMPLNISCTFGIKKIKIDIFGGPYAACAIGGYEIIGGSKFKYLTFGHSTTRDLRYFDLGINLGSGFEVKNYMFVGQVGLGLTDISPADDLIMKNKVIGISVIRLR